MDLLKQQSYFMLYDMDKRDNKTFVPCCTVIIMANLSI